MKLFELLCKHFDGMILQCGDHTVWTKESEDRCPIRTTVIKDPEADQYWIDISNAGRPINFKSRGEVARFLAGFYNVSCPVEEFVINGGV